VAIVILCWASTSCARTLSGAPCPCVDGWVCCVKVCDVLGGADTFDCNGRAAPAGIVCRPPACGDGYVNRAAGERCEGGADGG